MPNLIGFPLDFLSFLPPQYKRHFANKKGCSSRMSRLFLLAKMRLRSINFRYFLELSNKIAANLINFVF